MASQLSEEGIVSGFAAELVDEVVGESSKKWALLLLLLVFALVVGGVGASRLRNR
jgi:hypothetical protein